MSRKRLEVVLSTVFAIIWKRYELGCKLTLLTNRKFIQAFDWDRNR